MNDRLLKLENIVSYQDNTIKQLNDVIIEQTNRINKIEKTIDTIVSWIQENKEGPGSDFPVQRPPHY